MGANNAELHGRTEEFTDVVRRAGAKLTQQRLVIFETLARSSSHPDAEQVYRIVRRRIPSVSRDTVYRTLWMLNDLGLITTLSPPRRRIQFDANIRPHHHFLCTQCGVVADFENDAFDALSVADGIEALGSVETVRVELRGVCRRCSNKNTRDSPGGQSRDRRRR